LEILLQAVCPTKPGKAQAANPEGAKAQPGQSPEMGCTTGQLKKPRPNPPGVFLFLFALKKVQRTFFKFAF
jgi:hypothetical protein